MKKNRLIALVFAIAALTAMFSLYTIISALINRGSGQNAFDAITGIAKQENGITALG